MNEAIVFEAQQFAIKAHGQQKRKYTGEPYWKHLAEVAGIVSGLGWFEPTIGPTTVTAVAWLHDTIEDCDVVRDDLRQRFGCTIADAVLMLSDLETGNRAMRKAASRERLSRAPGWIQTIKCADLISNTACIVQHDPNFAITYLAEKRALLAVLHRADPRLRLWAVKQATADLREVNAIANK